jgi:Na+/H+ antiporter NhaA
MIIGTNQWEVLIMEVLTISAITVFVYATLCTRIHKNVIYLAAGHSFWVDLLFTGVIAIFAGVTGSLTAMMISSVTGLLISVGLFGLKWYHGSARFVRKINPTTGKKTFKIGVEFMPPTKEVPQFIQTIISYKQKVGSFIKPANSVVATA